MVTTTRRDGSFDNRHDVSNLWSTKLAYLLMSLRHESVQNGPARSVGVDHDGLNICRSLASHRCISCSALHYHKKRHASRLLIRG